MIRKCKKIIHLLKRVIIAIMIIIFTKRRKNIAHFYLKNMCIEDRLFSNFTYFNKLINASIVSNKLLTKIIYENTDYSIPHPKDQT